MSHSLPRRYLKKLISNFISLVSGFIVTSLVPRALGPLEFGKFSFITDIFSQVFILFEGGSSNALYNKVSHDHKNVLLLKKYSKFLILINVLIFGGLILGLFLDLSKYLFSGLETRFILMGFVYASLFWLNSIYVKVLDGLGLTSQMEQQRIYISVLRACCIISLFLIDKITLFNFFIFQILLISFLNFSFLRIIHRLSKQFSKKKNENLWEYFYKYSSPLFVYGFVSALATIADRWLLQKYSGLNQQGYFSLASQLGAICFLFSSSLTPLFHREIAIKTHNHDLDGIHNIIYKSFPILFFVAATLGIFSAINAPSLVHLVAGKDYSGHTLAYSLMFLYPIHQTYGQLIGSIYYASGETKLFRNVGIGLLLIGFTTSYFLLAPPELFGLNLGFTGAAIKSFALQILNVHVLLFFSFKKIRLKLSPFVYNQFVILFSLGFIAYFSKWASYLPASPILGLILNGILYLSLTVLLLYICYKKNLPILMRYTQENITFALNKFFALKTLIR